MRISDWSSDVCSSDLEQALEAFEALWLEGRGPTSPQLLIVGQAGWKTDALQQRLITHPLRDKHVRWLNDASDEYLEYLYASCRSEEHTSELQSLMRISYAVFCLNTKTSPTQDNPD